MNSILNITFAWLSLIVIILLCSLYPLSKLLENEKYNNEKIMKYKYYLKNIHKPLGVIVIFIMFIHGKLSGQRPGIEAILILLLSILLLLSYCLRKKFPKGWMIIHRSLTLLLLITIFIHVFLALQ